MSFLSLLSTLFNLFYSLLSLNISPAFFFLLGLVACFDLHLIPIHVRFYSAYFLCFVFLNATHPPFLSMPQLLSVCVSVELWLPQSLAGSLPTLPTVLCPPALLWHRTDVPEALGPSLCQHSASPSVPLSMRTTPARSPQLSSPLSCRHGEWRWALSRTPQPAKWRDIITGILLFIMARFRRVMEVWAAQNTFFFLLIWAQFCNFSD